MKKYILLLISGAYLMACNKQEAGFDATGNFETTEYVVAAENNGKLLQLKVEEGKEYKAGQLVGYVDTTQLYLKKKQLEASMRALLRKTPDIATQMLVLRQQLANLKTEKIRVENLVKEDAVPSKQLDDINQQIAFVEKQITAQSSALGTQSNSITAELEPLQVQIDQINDQIQKCLIINPVNGTVLSLYTEESEIVNFGKALYRIGNLQDIILRAYISGKQLSSVKLGQKVTVLIDTGSGEPKKYSGTIEWIASQSEFTPKIIQTKDERVNLVYAMKIKVKNDGSIKIGMPGEVIFQ